MPRTRRARRASTANGSASSNAKSAESSASQASENTATNDAGLTTVTYGRVHVEHPSVAFLVNPFWYVQILNEIWVAVFGAALLAILAIVIGTVAYVRRSKRTQS